MSIKTKDGSVAVAVVETGRRVERIMSDVWDDVGFAYVLKADGTYEYVSDVWATVDATPEQVVAFKAWQAAEKARRDAEEEARRRAYEAEQARLAAEKAAKVEALRAKNLAAEVGIEVVKGDVVKVVKGSNKGVAGKVFWIGNGKLGTKLGIALDDQKDSRGYHSNVAWVLKKNVAKAA